LRIAWSQSFTIYLRMYITIAQVLLIINAPLYPYIALNKTNSKKEAHTQDKTKNGVDFVCVAEKNSVWHGVQNLMKS
jgi:hypothetical protein